jgi:hypothetical protein
MASSFENPMNRRDFMKVILTTVSAAALRRPDKLWPVAERARPIAEPIQLLRTPEGYLRGPEVDRLPTYRRMLDFDALSENGKRNALLELWRMVHLEDFEDRVNDPDDTLDNEEALDELAQWHLDDEVNLESLSLRDSAKISEYGVGIEIYDALPETTAKRLGLELIVGDQPGSSFSGVAFYGEVDELNRELERVGLNLVVIEDE